MNDHDLTELIRRALESRAAEQFIAMPGIVVSYDAATKTAKIQPAIRRVLPDEDGNLGTEDLPILENVRVMFPACAHFSVHFTLEPGDGVELRWQQSSTAEYRQTGKVSTPGDLRVSGIGSPVAYPGFGADALVGPETDDSIGRTNGLRLHFAPSAISAGAGAQFVALAGLVQARLDALADALNGWIVVPNDGGAALKTALTDWANASNAVASSNLKAD